MCRARAEHSPRISAPARVRSVGVGCAAGHVEGLSAQHWVLAFDWHSPFSEKIGS